MSGASVIESDQLLVAIHVGSFDDADGNCLLAAHAPNLTSDSDPKTCDKESGGVLGQVADGSQCPVSRACCLISEATKVSLLFV